MSLKNPVTPLGIHPGTARLVAQRFNHYATPVPKMDGTYIKITFIMTSILVALVKRVLERYWYQHVYLTSNTNDA